MSRIGRVRFDTAPRGCSRRSRTLEFRRWEQRKARKIRRGAHATGSVQRVDGIRANPSPGKGDGEAGDHSVPHRGDKRQNAAREGNFQPRDAGSEVRVGRETSPSRKVHFAGNQPDKLGEFFAGSLQDFSCQTVTLGSAAGDHRGERREVGRR